MEPQEQNSPFRHDGLPGARKKPCAPPADWWSSDDVTQPAPLPDGRCSPDPFPVEAPPAASRGPGVAGGSAAREGGAGLGAEGAQDSVLRCWWRFTGVGLSRRAGEAAGRGERTAEGGGGDRCGRARAGSGGALGRSGGRHPARSEEVRAGVFWHSFSPRLHSPALQPSCGPRGYLGQLEAAGV